MFHWKANQQIQEIRGDLWDHYRCGKVVVITTGGLVGKSDHCSMPRGCAHQAKDQFEGLARTLGQLILQHGNHVFDLGNRILRLPVEESPFEVPEMHLIESSCRELVKLTDDSGWTQVIVPRPGCGAGGLSWADVKPKLAPIFDERYLIISSAG